MNNEETIIAQPNAQEQGQQKQEKKEGKGKAIAATVAASTIGGVAGGAGTAAAMNYATQAKAEEQAAEEQVTNEPEAKVEEQPASVKTEPQKETTPEPEHVEVTAKVDDAPEPDYTNHGNADPVVETTSQPTAQPAVDEGATPQVQVLGVYENVTEEGVHQTAAVLTNGTEVAVVADVDGDGIADVLAVDENHNQQLDEGEVVDFSDQNVHMSDYQQAYLAQQEEMAQQQQMDDMAYNASDDTMQDYDNDAYVGA